jgi:predicted Zn-dependent protease
MRVMLFLVGLGLAAQDRPNWYSVEKEAALGAELVQETRARIQPIENPAVQAFVGRVGARLAAQIPEAGFPFQFAIYRGDERGLREPIALPGGYVFISSGLFFAAQDEDEFAGMLAHAIAHIAERHMTRLATRSQVANQATVPLIFMGAWPPAAGQLLPRSAAVFQRGLEREADALAARILQSAAYHPGALGRYIAREQRDDPGSGIPAAAERLKIMPPEGNASPSDEFLSMRALLSNH